MGCWRESEVSPPRVLLIQHVYSTQIKFGLLVVWASGETGCIFEDQARNEWDKQITEESNVSIWK